MINKYEISYFALFFFAGILASSLVAPPAAIIFISLLLSAVVLFINRKSLYNKRASFLLMIFFLGMLDYRLASLFGGKLDEFDGRTAVYECLITDNPADKGTYVQYTAKCISAAYGGKTFNYTDGVFIKVFGNNAYKYGDLIKVEGICGNISPPRNPGDFDFRKYYKSKGINKVISAGNTAMLRENKAGMLAGALYLSREKVRAVINDALPEEEASILVGIITGDKSGIDEETRTDYIQSGLSHILSVSGLHVGFLMLLITGILKPFRLEEKVEGAIVLAVIMYYILLIGAPLPSVRAFIMLLVLIAGKLAGRQYNLLSSISFAALLILIFKPLSIHDPGFIISFASMYSIAFLYEPVYKKLGKIPPYIRGILAMSLSVWLGLAPVLVHYFNYISFASILINLAAVPLAFIITVAGFIGVLAGIFSGTAALYVFSVDYYLIRLLSLLTHEASSYKLSGAYVPTLPLHMYALYYAVLLTFASASYVPSIKIYGRRFIILYALIFSASIFIYCIPVKELRVVFFDVGQGDASCIITPDKKAVLVDGGGASRNSDYYYDIGGRITLPGLLRQGIWKLDTVIVSHFHDDHMEGLLKILEVYPVKNLIIPKVSAGTEFVSPNSSPLLELCREKKINVYSMGKGDSIKLGRDVRIDFFMPESPTGKEYKNDENDNSLVGRLVYGDFSVLYPGDIGKAVEDKLSDIYMDSTVLKVPHHGSRNSSSESFVKAVSPNVSIISVGKNNFGHPSAEAIERLSAAGNIVCRTDESGAAIITTDGKTMKVRTMK